MEELEHVYGDSEQLKQAMEHIPDWVKNCFKDKGGSAIDGNEVDNEWNNVIVMDPPTLIW